MKNRIVILGTGNVAQALASAVSRSAFSLVQVYGRNPEKAQALARQHATAYTSSLHDLLPADVYLVSVSDDSIPAVTAGMTAASGAVVAHTAGSVSENAISPHIRHRGILYPLQTFTSGRDLDFNSVPLFVTGSDAAAVSALSELAHALSEQVAVTDEDTLRRLHLSAVFACNFGNHMVALAQRVLTETGLPPTLLNPLIAETAAKTIDAAHAAAGRSADPAAHKTGQDHRSAAAPPAVRMQTGPAVRGDRNTCNQHLKLLENDPELQEIYHIISKSIWETSKKI